MPVRPQLILFSLKRLPSSGPGTPLSFGPISSMPAFGVKCYS